MLNFGQVWLFKVASLNRWIYYKVGSGHLCWAVRAGVPVQPATPKWAQWTPAYRVIFQAYRAILSQIRGPLWEISAAKGSILAGNCFVFEHFGGVGQERRPKMAQLLDWHVEMSGTQSCDSSYFWWFMKTLPIINLRIWNGITLQLTNVLSLFMRKISAN